MRPPDWTPLLRAADAQAAAFARALADPGGAQRALLARIVAANADSEFGKAHGFAHITELTDYRRRVPVAGYEGFAPLIDRVAMGEPGVLTAAPVIAFEETGGTGSGGKLVPYTQAGLAGFRRAVLPWLSDLARRRPGITAGRAYVTISPATRAPRCTPGGIAIGLESDAAYLGEELAGDFAALLAVPPETALIGELAAWQVASLQALITASDLSFVSLWSPTFLTALLAALEPNADAVMAGLDAPARRRLGQALAGSALDTALLWPKLDCISCWNDGPSAAYAAQLAALFPQAGIEPKGLLATEAAITLPFGTAGACVPALLSCVTEFIGTDGEPRLCDELSEGETYRTVLTTESGLYRYDIGDLVECTGAAGPVPQLRFAGRAGRASDLVGEKLTESFVSAALGFLPFPAMLAARSDPPHYALLFDDIATRDPQSHLAALEARLCANPQYAHARRLSQLAPLQAVPCPGMARQAVHRGIAAGRRMGDLKPVALVPLGDKERPLP